MKKTLALLLVAVMILASFAGCDTKDKAGKSTGGWVNDRLKQAATIFNPHATTTEYDTYFFEKCCVALYSTFIAEGGTSYEYRPVLADGLPEKADAEGKEWKIKITKDAKWANGDPMNADTVIYSWKMLLSPDLAWPCSNTLTASSNFRMKNAEEYNLGNCNWEDVGIKKADDYAIIISSDTPATQYQVMKFCDGLYMVYEPLYSGGMSEDGSYTNYGTTIETFMSAGAFTLTNWLTDAQFTITRNPDYRYADEIFIDGIIVKVVPDDQTALEMFLQGELDKVKIGSAVYETFEEDPRVKEYFDDSLMYIFVNLGNPDQNRLLGNINFRNTLYYGIDRVAVADVMVAYPVTRYVRQAVIGDPVTGTKFVDMPGSKDYIDDPYTVFDVEKAKTYLDKALEECKLTSSHFEFIYPESAGTSSRARNEMIQKQFKDQFGGKLEVRLRAITGSTIELRRWNPDNPTAFEGSVGSLYPAADDMTAGFKVFTSEYNPPRFYYSNPEFDALYARSISAEAAADNNLRLSLCQQMEKTILDQRVIIPLYETPDRVLISDRIKLPVEEYITGFGGIGGGFGFPSYVSVAE